jgi:hypothetical protein
MGRHIGANVPRLARRSPKPLGWVQFPTVPAICASNSVGRVAAFGEVIQLEENANASSNLAFSTISRLSGVRVTSGAPYPAVVQLVEHFIWDEGVERSSRSCWTNSKKKT